MLNKLMRYAQTLQDFLSPHVKKEEDDVKK